MAYKSAASFICTPVLGPKGYLYSFSKPAGVVAGDVILLALMFDYNGSLIPRLSIFTPEFVNTSDKDPWYYVNQDYCRFSCHYICQRLVKADDPETYSFYAFNSSTASNFAVNEINPNIVLQAYYAPTVQGALVVFSDLEVGLKAGTPFLIEKSSYIYQNIASPATISGPPPPIQDGTWNIAKAEADYAFVWVTETNNVGAQSFSVNGNGIPLTLRVTQSNASYRNGIAIATVDAESRGTSTANASAIMTLAGATLNIDWNWAFGISFPRKRAAGIVMNSQSDGRNPGGYRVNIGSSSPPLIKNHERFECVVYRCAAATNNFELYNGHSIYESPRQEREVVSSPVKTTSVNNLLTAIIRTEVGGEPYIYTYPDPDVSVYVYPKLVGEPTIVKNSDPEQWGTEYAFDQSLNLRNDSNDIIINAGIVLATGEGTAKVSQTYTNSSSSYVSYVLPQSAGSVPLTITSVSPYCMIIAIFAYDDQQGQGGVTITPPAGYTSFASDQTQPSSTSVAFSAAYKIVTAVGEHGGNWALTGNTATDKAWSECRIVVQGNALARSRFNRR